MASTTMTVYVRMYRLWPLLWWMWLAGRLLRFGLSAECAVSVGNRCLGWARVACHDGRGRRFAKVQPFPGRIVIDEDAGDGTIKTVGWP